MPQEEVVEKESKESQNEEVGEEPKENQDDLGQNEQNTPSYRGLYGKVNVPTKALDAVIIGCCLVIVIVFALSMRNPGFTITYESKGGSDVESQQYMYGDYIEAPEEPYREGYEFMGWYVDEGYDIAWNFDEDVVTEDITLYALWQESD